ncbi:alpha/beta hydrolase [Hymenobacter terrenus]|uniref:dienelactone hydrolase family protein n=1 Tax=Hymenobacter terrenus TaxID=1629124 RepID=UPI00069607E4|nr:dienelactone hydrolase family protein [Hymenobacter terrenus]
MKFLLFFAFVVTPFISFAQYAPKLDEYKHYQIIKNRDTINYHVYAKGGFKEKTGFIIFFHGSGKEPFFTSGVTIDTIKITGNEAGKIQRFNYRTSSVPFDLDRIPNNYAFVVISKKGIPFFWNNAIPNTSQEFKAPKSFYTTESLDYRVWQGDEVIKAVKKTLVKKPTKIVLIGHSEGSHVAAKLGTVNKSITHIGYWAGGGDTQYYDYVLFIRRAVHKGEITEEEAKVRINSLLTQISDIENDPHNIDKKWRGHSYQRWSTFTEPSINNLLKIKVPLFVAVGALDTSVPIESSYLIPIEFIRYKKRNLSFNVYPHYDHSFRTSSINSTQQADNGFMKVFEEFMDWVEK